MKLTLAETFTVENAREIIDTLEQEYQKLLNPKCAALVLDFSRCRFMSPIGIVYMDMYIDQIKKLGKDLRYIPPENLHHLFPKQQEAKIRRQFFSKAFQCWNAKECFSAQQEICEDFRSHAMENETLSACAYMLNELGDNAGVHGYQHYYSDDYSKSYPSPIYMCGMKYENRFEFCIGDLGQGIFQSLHSHNKGLKMSGNKDYVSASIQEGISGHPDASAGFGLYATAEFIRNGGGQLHIWSSKCYLNITERYKRERKYTTFFERGTIISFVIGANAEIPFYEIMERKTGSDYYEAEYLEMMMGDDDNEPCDES